MRGASSAGGTAMTREVSSAGGRPVDERVGIYRVGWSTPGLDLLGEALGVGGCEDSNLGAVAERFRQVIQQSGDGLGDPDGREDPGTEKGVAAEAIVEGILWAGDVCVYP
jgi:hypothetical protein